MPTTRMLTLDEIKGYLPIRAGNTQFDARLHRLIDSASSRIESACRQTFTQSTRIEFHTSRSAVKRTYNLYDDSPWPVSVTGEDQVLILRASPLVVDDDHHVTVWYDRWRKFGDSTVVDPRHYFVDPNPDNSRIILNTPTEYGLAAIKVSYTAGYAIGGDDDNTISAALDADAPDLKRAAILTALHYWNRENPEAVGTNENSGDVKKGSTRGSIPILNSYGIPQEAMDLIGEFRRVLTGSR